MLLCSTVCRFTFTKTKAMKYLLSVFIVAVLGLSTAYAQECDGVPSPKEVGEVTTFYAYAYHTNRYNQELRVSPIFKISYNFDPKSRVDQTKIALRMSQDFMFFVKDMRSDGTHTTNELANSTQNKGTLICMNRAAVVEHRAQYIEEFLEMDKPVIEENGYNFVYKFNQFYKASTKVGVTRM